MVSVFVKAKKKAHMLVMLRLSQFQYHLAAELAGVSLIPWGPWKDIKTSRLLEKPIPNDSFARADYNIIENKGLHELITSFS